MVVHLASRGGVQRARREPGAHVRDSVAGGVALFHSAVAAVAAVVEGLARQHGEGRRVEHAPARGAEVRRSCLDVARARSWLGWTPSTTLEQGLARTLAGFGRRLGPGMEDLTR